jgi:Ni/Co efflux regulator RcnB
MKRIITLFALAIAMLSAEEALAQKKPPRQTDVVTPADGANKEKENRRKKEEEYKMKKEKHDLIQDKATRKRMKESRKKSNKTGNGNRLPWYKKIFW